MSRLLKLIPRRVRFIGLAMALSLVAGVPLLSKAHVATTNITIVNNTDREIRNVYLSAPDSNNWGPDQLGNSVIAGGGGSATISASCNGASIKVIAEDHEGCFFYQVVSCGQSSNWTIASGTTPDCGSGN